jgi:hypothetical protein
MIGRVCSSNEKVRNACIILINLNGTKRKGEKLMMEAKNTYEMSVNIYQLDGVSSRKVIFD